MLNTIEKATKVDPKLMKLALNCAEFKLIEAIGNTKAEVDTKLIELVLNGTESKLNQAKSKGRSAQKQSLYYFAN